MKNTFGSLVCRRDFLKLSATIAAATALPPLTLKAAEGATAASRTKRNIKKAIMWGTVGVKGSVLEKMQLVKEAGFEGVEPNGGMDQDEVVKAMDATGLKAASVCCHTHWAKPLSDPNPAARDVGLEGLKLSLRDAKRLWGRLGPAGARCGPRRCQLRTMLGAVD